MIKPLCVAALLLALAPAAQAQLRGHGGPVRALAISPDGSEAVSGSFDTSAIRWSLTRNIAEQVMRFHDNAVNAVVWLKDGRIVTTGADAHIAIWTPGQPQPDKVLDGHAGPIVALAVSPDGKLLASASWDHTARLWPLDGGVPRVLEGNSQNVNGVAFTPDGATVVTAGYDATLRIWPLGGNGSPTVRNLPTPLNAVAVAPDGEIVTAGADGKVYFLSPQGDVRGDVQASETPVITLALSRDGVLLAAAGIRGSVAVIDRKARELERTLVGP
ncbi:MAG: WD40 repeat domain-containing protein, partial [Candidatus Binataceae bacterium]